MGKVEVDLPEGTVSGVIYMRGNWLAWALAEASEHEAFA